MEELVEKLNKLLESFDLRHNFMPNRVNEWILIISDVIVFLCALYEFQSGSVELAFKSFCIVLLMSMLYVMVKYLESAKKIISVLSRFIHALIGAVVEKPKYNIGDTVCFTRNGCREKHKVTAIRFQPFPEGGGSWSFQADDAEWLMEQDVKDLTIVNEA